MAGIGFPEPDSRSQFQFHRDFTTIVTEIRHRGFQMARAIHLQLGGTNHQIVIAIRKPGGQIYEWGTKLSVGHLAGQIHAISKIIRRLAGSGTSVHRFRGIMLGQLAIKHQGHPVGHAQGLPPVMGHQEGRHSQLPL